MSRGPGVLAHKRGSAGEDAAYAYLTGLGYLILERNFKTRFGEIDLIARDQHTLVFIEVKRRENTDHGTAAEFVTRSKMRKVVGAARIYAAQHGLSDNLIRFDVVAIDVIDGHEQLRHHKGAFDAS
ncbi:MAG: YraN family protein [Vicinamibacteria bacterium]